MDLWQPCYRANAGGRLRLDWNGAEAHLAGPGRDRGERRILFLSFEATTERQDRLRARRRSVSSDWAMSACRWRWNSQRPDFPSPVSMCSRRRLTRVNRGESYILDVPSGHTEAAWSSGKHSRHHRFRRHRANSTPSTSACRRRCAKPRIPDMSYIVVGLSGDREATSTPACW